MLSEIPNEPSRQVDPENADLGSAVQRLAQEVRALRGALQSPTDQRLLGDISKTLTRQLHMQQQFMGRQGGGASETAAAGMMFGQSLPQARQEALHAIAEYGGMPTEHAQRGMVRVTNLGALSSLENMQAYLAQRAGEFIAGRSLYADPNEEAGGGPPPGVTTTQDVLAAATAEAQQTSATVQAAEGTLGAGGGAADTSAGVGQVVAAGSRLAALGARTGPRAGGPAAPTGFWQVPTGARARWGPMQQIGARVALSGGTAQGLLGALRRLPVIGLGLDIAQKAADFYQTQREEGRQFQTIEGGSNIQGQYERWHEMVYGLSMFGRMNEASANYAFNAVTAMGLNRAQPQNAYQAQNRQNALGFIYQNYTNTGMSVQESVRMLDVATRNVSINLNTVRDALNELSNTAGQAGVNAQGARQSFGQLLGAAMQGGAGIGAPAVAGGVANLQAALGRPFAGLNMTGGLGQQRQYMLAGQLGISPNQLQWMERFRPAQYAQALGTANRQWIENSGINQMALNDLQSMINNTPGAKENNAAGINTRDQVFNQWLYKWQAQDPSINLYSMSQVLSRLTGYPINPNNVGDYITASYANINEGTGARRLADRGQAVRAGHMAGAPTGRFGLAQPTQPTSGVASRLIGPSTVGAAPGSWQATLLGGGAPEAARAYLANEGKTGMRNPVLESLLQSNMPGDALVNVQTRTGPRVMSVANAMKYYPNELAQGNVEFMDSSGKPLGTTGGFTGGLTAPTTGTLAEQQQRAGSNVGTPLAAWRQHHQQAFQGPGSARAGNVTVDLTQEARQLLKLLPGVNDQAAAQGYPSANPAVSQSSR